MPIRALLLTASLLLVSAPAHGQCQSIGAPGLNGCGGFTPWGIPQLSCSGAPVRGNASFSLTSTDPCLGRMAFLLVGMCRAQPFVIRGPYGAGGFCGPSQAVCAAVVDPIVAAAIRGTRSPGAFTFGLPVPNDPSLAGVVFCAQAVFDCATGSCIGASNGVSIVVQ